MKLCQKLKKSMIKKSEGTFLSQRSWCYFSAKWPKRKNQKAISIQLPVNKIISISIISNFFFQKGRFFQICNTFLDILRLGPFWQFPKNASFFKKEHIFLHIYRKWSYLGQMAKKRYVLKKRQLFHCWKFSQNYSTFVILFIFLPQICPYPPCN